MTDLEVKVSQQPGKIVCNFNEIKEALKLQMSAYTSLEITEECQKEAKSDLATLRKIRKAVDDKRKAVKNEFMIPYSDFESNVKDLLAVIDDPIEMIDSKLKSFEEKRIEEKQQHLHELYENGVGEYSEYLPYHMVASPKWNNATCKDSDVQYAISEAVLKVKTDLETIRMLGSEIEDELLKAYKNAGNNLQVAVQKNNDYLQAKRIAEEKLKENKQEQIDIKAIPDPAPMKEIIDVKQTSTTEESEVAVFKISGQSNIEAVKDFMNLSNIDYEVLS